MQRFILILLCTVGFVTNSFADEVASFGGNVSCQTFLNDKANAKEGGAWVFGVWTGMNVMAAMRSDAHDIGHTLTPAQVITSVLALCQRQPSSQLAVAVGQARTLAKSQGR